MGILVSVLRLLLRPLAARRPTLFFGAQDAVVVVHDDAGHHRNMSMENFVKTRVPSLLEPFTPAWWCPTGHGQTVYCVIGNFSKRDQVVYERKLLRLSDGGTIGLDFTHGHNTLPDDTPVIVVKHGLTGGSYESYVRAVLSRACAPSSKGGLGFRAVVCNFRGCAGVPVTSAQFYSAGHTDDLRTALSYIRTLYPKARLLGMGFSLGANVVTRYLSEEGERSRLVGGLVLGCPWDVLDNSKHLEGGFLSRNVYSKAMAKNLVSLFRRNAHYIDAISASSSPQKAHLDELGVMAKIMDERWVRGKGLIDVDAVMVVNLGGSFAPHGPFPFANAEDYYAWASSHKVLPGVRVPLLALSASDDPVVHTVPTDCGANPHVAVALTHAGGHLGWFEDDGTRWFVRPALEFLAALANDVEPSSSAELEPAVREAEDGFFREEGENRQHIGWKLVKDGEVVVANQGAAGLVAGL